MNYQKEVPPIEKKGIKTMIEELKQWHKAKAEKTRRLKKG